MQKFKTKKIEDLNANEVIYGLQLHVSGRIKRLSWAYLGRYIEHHLIGFEGCSAWGWINKSYCIGYTGGRPLIAIGKVLIRVCTKCSYMQVPDDD